MTYGSLIISPEQSSLLQFNFTSSTYGRCNSGGVGESLVFIEIISSMLPIQCSCWQSGHIHTGIGVPQYLSRLIAQSLIFDSHSPILFDPVHSGAHSTSELYSRICSRTAVIFTNQLSIA